MNKNRVSVIYHTLWITFLILCISEPIESLQCYVCNSIDDMSCVELNGDKYLHNCTDMDSKDGKNHTNCRKQVYSAESKAYDWNVERVVRSCGYERHPKYDCFYSSTVDLKSTTCECETDKCNTGQRMSSDVTMLSSLIMFGLLLIT